MHSAVNRPPNGTAELSQSVPACVPVPAPAAIPFTSQADQPVSPQFNMDGGDDNYSLASEAEETAEEVMEDQVVFMGSEKGEVEAVVDLSASDNHPDMAEENGPLTNPVQETNPVTTYTPSTESLSTELSGVVNDSGTP